jgi:hypothetical protein
VTGAAEVIAIYLSLRTSAPRTNTGLPCPYCQEKLPSLQISFGGDTEAHPRGSDARTLVRVAKAMNPDEVRDLALFLQKAANGDLLADDEDENDPPKGTA